MSGLQPQQILIVEDDPQLARVLEVELNRSYKTRVAGTGRTALFLAETEPFDLILLDLNLPDVDGLEVARQLARNDAQILMVTARADVKSRVSGLDAGASDYLAKPFDLSELVARVAARLRGRADPDVVRAGGLELKHSSQTCTVDGIEVPLTAQETRLLSVLMVNQGRVFSREDIEARLYRGKRPNSNTVEALLSKLRRKLSAVGAGHSIRTIRGLGYVIR